MCFLHKKVFLPSKISNFKILKKHGKYLLFINTNQSLRVETANMHLTGHLDSLIRCSVKVRTLYFLVKEEYRFFNIL